MTDPDLDLLRQYAQGSEQAFTTLVSRHLPLVYSAALRQVRSPQLAEEVAQSTFTDLARNVHKLKPDTILTAWLYQVTRRTAIDVIRRESRRQLREHIATEMNAINATNQDWPLIEHHLDEAMETLDITDRMAILLRYFENKSLREVGATLGTSDDAAQKRVTRAVDRLRDFFTKRGVTVGSAGLVIVLSANAVHAAPAGLAATISTAALAGSTIVATTATVTATKTIAMTALQKTIVTATIVVLAGAGIYEARQASQLREKNQAFQQQRTPLEEQIARLNQALMDATNQLATLRDDNARLNRNTAELRGKIVGLQTMLAAAREQKPVMASSTKPSGGPTLVLLPSNQVVNIDPSKVRIANATTTTTPANLSFVDVKQLQGIGNATPEMAAQAALGQVLNGDGSGLTQLTHHDAQSNEGAEEIAVKLFGHLATELSGASQVAFMPPAALGEDHSVVQFVASWPAGADAKPKSTTGSLFFSRANDHWYLDQFAPQSQTLMFKGNSPASQ